MRTIENDPLWDEIYWMYPGLSDQGFHELFWNCTPFPAGGTDSVMKRLRYYSPTYKRGGLDAVMEQSYRELDEEMALLNLTPEAEK